MEGCWRFVKIACHGYVAELGLHVKDCCISEAGFVVEYVQFDMTGWSLSNWDSRSDTTARLQTYSNCSATVSAP